MELTTLKHLLNGRSWMADDEALLAQALLECLLNTLNERGVEETSLVLLRAEDIVVNYVLARRLETALTPGKLESAPLEALGKARERLRKSMKELEDYCTRSGKPIDTGFADIMKPVLKKAQGVLEDAIAFETRRQKAALEPQAESDSSG